MGEVSYQDYIESDTWKAKRQKCLDSAGGRCEICNRSSNLDVHHRTYVRFGGNEKTSDLTVLCHTCHRIFHDRLALHSPADSLPEGAPQEKQDASAEPEIKDALEELEAAQGGDVIGIPSGFPKLDALTGGWQPSDLVVIAARPSMGKTSFGLACAANAVTRSDDPVGTAIFSLEMKGEQLMRRFLTMEARVDGNKARTGRMEDNDWQQLARTAGELSEADIEIHCSPQLRISELREEAEALSRRKDIGLIVVDGLAKLSIETDNYDGYRQFELRDIVGRLKSMAGELDVPVIVTSGLTRATEKRGGDKRPRLADLPKCEGALENEADVIAFIYRPEFYGITVDEQGNSTEGIAEIIVGKQRNGPIGTVELAFVDQYARFEPLTTQYDDPGGPTPDANAGGGGNSFEDDAPF